MKNFIVFITVLSFLTSCSSKMSKTFKNYKFIQTYSFPTTNENDSLYQHIDSSMVYLLNNMRIFKISYQESKEGFDKNVSDSSKWYFLGHRANDKKAFYANDLKNAEINMANIDSFYKSWPNAQFLDSSVKQEVIKAGSETLISTKQQFYSFAMEGFESITLFFDKTLNAVPYSLSPTIDSLFKAKLSGVKLVINKKDFPPNAADNLRVIEIKLKWVAITNEDSAVFNFQNRVDSIYKNVSTSKKIK